jgi:autotransporter-associated beta strand protein
LNAGGTYASEPLTLNGFGVKSGGVGIGALENLSGANVLNGNITLGIASSIGMTSGSLALGGVISGANPLTVTGPGSLTLSGANTYSAGTIVNGATLFLNGSLPAGNAVSVSGGGTLAGVGTINGPVTIASGANLVPGVNGVGRLTVNGPLALAGTTTMELNKAGSTNDSVVGITTVTYGGTLNVSNLGGTLAGGDKFTLFSSLDRIGTFTSVNLPALGSGLSWTNMLSIDGSIMVLGGVNTARTNITYSVSGNSMTLSWPSDHTGWRLLAQTNHLNTGVSGNPVDWGTVPGSSSTNSVTVPLDGSKPSEFYKLVYP